MTATFKLTGARQMAEALRALGREAATQMIERAVVKGSAEIAAAARMTSGFTDQTGVLRDSIHVSRQIDKASNERTAYYGTGVFYGRFLEFGTVHISARSWLRNAMDSTAHIALQEMVDSLAKDIDKVVVQHGGQAGTVPRVTVSRID
jgi:HK97 gp10 family phage protein